MNTAMVLEFTTLLLQNKFLEFAKLLDLSSKGSLLETMDSMEKLGFKPFKMENVISFPSEETISVTQIWLRESSTVLNSPISLISQPFIGTPREIRQSATLIIPTLKRNDLYNLYPLNISCKFLRDKIDKLSSNIREDEKKESIYPIINGSR